MSIQLIPFVQVPVIFVCDDEIPVLHHLEHLLHQYTQNTQKNNLSIEVCCFLDWQSMNATLQHHVPAHIFILDVELPDVDGISIGQILRARYGNSTELIYISNDREHAFSGFQNHPIGFLEKPIDENKLYYTLRQCFRMLHDQLQVLQFQCGGHLCTAPIADILYIEVYNKSTFIHTIDGVYELRVALQVLYDILEPHDFIIPHRSFIIPVHGIEDLQLHSLSLKRSTTSIPVSRGNYEKTKSAIHTHIMNKMRQKKSIF